MPIPKNGGSHAELESVICIFTASPGADAHIYSRSNFNRDDGGHDTPRYAGRRARRRVVLQKEGKHELCVPDSRAVSGGHERKRRHLHPTQASLERRSTHGADLILKAPRLPEPDLKARRSSPIRACDCVSEARSERIQNRETGSSSRSAALLHRKPRQAFGKGDSSSSLGDHLIPRGILEAHHPENLKGR